VLGDIGNYECEEDLEESEEVSEDIESGGEEHTTASED